MGRTRRVRDRGTRTGTLLRPTRRRSRRRRRRGELPAEGGRLGARGGASIATFVEYQSRPTMPRFDLAPLAKKLNAIDDRLAAEQRWEVAGITDTGPLLRVNDGARRLTKAERYGSPDERR